MEEKKELRTPSKHEIKNEDRFRRELMDYAKIIGADVELGMIFDKWDKAINSAPPNEKEDMAVMAILEINNFLGIVPIEGMTINGKVIVPPSNKKHDTIVVPVAVKEHK